MIIRLDDITFEQDRHEYLKNISLEFKTGRFYALTSSSKTDRLDFLLDIIFGIYLPSKGEVSWGGKNIFFQPELRGQSYYLSSRWMPPLFLKVKDLIDKNSLTTEMIEIFKKNKVGLETKLSELNTRQFFGIYCVLAIQKKPAIVIIDFFGSSFRSSDEPWVFSLLDQLRQNSLIIAKLDYNSPNIAFCDHLVFFHNGQIAKEISREEIQKNYVTKRSHNVLEGPWKKIHGTEESYIGELKDISNLQGLDDSDLANLADFAKRQVTEITNGRDRKAS